MPLKPKKPARKSFDDNDKKERSSKSPRESKPFNEFRRDPSRRSAPKLSNKEFEKIPPRKSYNEGIDSSKPSYKKDFDKNDG